MNKDELKNIAESLIETFNYAGKESIKLFKEGLKILNKLVITWVDADDLEGDVYFPSFNINEWKEIDSKDFSRSADNQFDFTVKEYLKL